MDVKATPASGSVIVGVDDPDLRDIVVSFLDARGWSAAGMAPSEDVLVRVWMGSVSSVVLDARSTSCIGLRLLERLRAGDPVFPVVVITSFGGRFVTERATRLRASKVLDHAFDPEDLDRALRELMATGT